MPITLISNVPGLYVGHPDLPVKNFKAFVAYAKSKPGQLNYGSADRLQAAALAVGNARAKFEAFIKQEQARWKPMIARAKIVPEGV